MEELCLACESTINLYVFQNNPAAGKWPDTALQMCSEGTRCFHTVTFGGKLWILEHYSFIGFLFVLFYSFVLGFAYFEVRFAGAEMTVYS